MKQCSHCKRLLSEDSFGVDNSRPDHLKVHCKTCQRVMYRELRGDSTYDKHTSCTWYLGVHIAEPMLLEYFGNATRAQPNTVGYDYICSKGYKIDVKASCVIQPKWTSPYWGFGIRRNNIADYFLCIAFDNRTDLNILHTWLIPALVVVDKLMLHVGCGTRSQLKYKEYEI